MPEEPETTETSLRPYAFPRWARRGAWVAGVVTAGLAGFVIARTVDTAALTRAVRAGTGDPLRLALALGAFGSAFAVRGAVWRRLLPSLPFAHALAAIHLSLVGNHVLPMRMGEPLRVLSAVRRAGVGLEPATASTLTLRAADLLALTALGWLVGPAVVSRLAGPWTWPVLGVLAAGCAAGLVWLRALARQRGAEVRLPDGLAIVGTGVAWLLEAVLVWHSARWAGLTLSPGDAVVVTASSVVAQVAALAPGGVGTYEAAGVAAYTALGFPTGPALAAALTAHALKTGYALVAGAVALVAPRPGLVGRLRLERRLPRAWIGPPPNGPVVFFLPARDEEATVADVVRRVPARVSGRPVVTLVVDDGSADATAARAAAAGARVVSLGRPLGLGAAVRRGLAEACTLGAAAVAFCDADGEYAPEELGRVVGPVLAGDADYVVGSRFAGAARRMRWHRRVGNRALTWVLGLVARRAISDGQSGYRALSRAAAEAAEIVHDYNYAQVLTLDLLDKGFRYAEVPVSYRCRDKGRSFVRLGPYLRRVIPAVYRELNPPASVPRHA